NHFKVEIVVGKVGLVLAQVADHATGPGNRSGAAQIDGVFLRQDADPLHAIDKDPVASQQARNIGVGLGKTPDERPNFLDKSIVHVVHEATDARVARMETLPGRSLANVVNQLTLIEGVEKSGERPQVEGGGADVQQMVVDPHQLGENRSDVFAAR